MDLLFRGQAEYGNEAVIISDEETESDTEYVGMIIKEESVPTGYEEDYCVVHYIMIALTLAFAVYNVVRVFQRSKEHREQNQELVDTN